jgi:hypothetical protein
MLGPGDEPGAGGKGRGHMRASRADRDCVVEVLKSAFVQERLAKDELDDRIGRALAARIWKDLDALIADIPAGSHLARQPVLAAAGLGGPAGARRTAAGPDPVQAVTAQAPGWPASPTRNRSMTRSARIWAAGIAVIILMSGVWAGILGGPGAGLIVASLATGFVFVALWVVACCAMLRERPGPGTEAAETGTGGPAPGQEAPAEMGEPG